MICKKVREILVDAFLKILSSYSEEFPKVPSFVKNSERFTLFPRTQVLLGIISHESSFST